MSELCCHLAFVCGVTHSQCADCAADWFPNIEGVLNACRAAPTRCLSAASGTPIETDADLANHLLSAANVVALPGSEFGAPGYMRLAYCVPMDVIDRGIAALIAELASLLERATA